MITITWTCPNKFLSLNTEHSCSLLYIIYLNTYMDTALSKSKIIVFTHNSSSFINRKTKFTTLVLFFKITSCKKLLFIYSYIDELLILWKCFRLNKRSRTLKQRFLKMLSTGFAKRVVLWCTRSVSRTNYVPYLPHSHPFQYSFAFDRRHCEAHTSRKRGKGCSRRFGHGHRMTFVVQRTTLRLRFIDAIDNLKNHF